MRALKTQDIAGNVYYVKCDDLRTNSAIVVKTFQREKYHEEGATLRFFRNEAHLYRWLKKHPEQLIFGVHTRSTGCKMGNSGRNKVYNFEK